MKSLAAIFALLFIVRKPDVAPLGYYDRFSGLSNT